MATTKVRVKCGEFWLEVDAQDVKEAFRGLANYLEVFSESKCGACQSTAIRPSHRTKDSFDFYELVCCQCGAVLRLGQAVNVREISSSSTVGYSFERGENDMKRKPKPAEKPVAERIADRLFDGEGEQCILLAPLQLLNGKNGLTEQTKAYFLRETVVEIINEELAKEKSHAH